MGATFRSDAQVIFSHVIRVGGVALPKPIEVRFARGSVGELGCRNSLYDGTILRLCRLMVALESALSQCLKPGGCDYPLDAKASAVRRFGREAAQ